MMNAGLKLTKVNLRSLIGCCPMPIRSPFQEFERIERFFRSPSFGSHDPHLFGLEGVVFSLIPAFIS